jgi:hypothetical protein
VLFVIVTEIGLSLAVSGTVPEVVIQEITKEMM